MKLHRGIVWVALVAICCVPAAMGQQKKGPAAKRAPNPAMLPIQDKPGLPRVLLIGDSISIGYTIPVREALAGKANVHRPKDNCGPTSRGLEKLDEWLGKGRWDVIHFNFGLHDLYYVEGKHRVPIEQYEKNLRQITERLKKTGATLVWCSTTPVPPGCEPNRKAGDEVPYNVVAKKIMDENHIAIDDLCSFARPQLDKIQLPKNVHFSAEGSKVLAGQVAGTIVKALAARKQ
jgi:acyl-CoA thioesterase-1